GAAEEGLGRTDTRRLCKTPGREIDYTGERTLNYTATQIGVMSLLPEHLHCLWTLPPGDHDFPTRWNLIKGHFTRHCPPDFKTPPDAARTRKREQAVWQRRYWEHRIRDEADFARHCNYIHYNPVKHGLAQRAGDWPWSIFRRFVAQGVYAPDWGDAVWTGSPNGEFGE
ncbi:MAG: REP-associated tyrosine transposase, partial [Pseudomonadota bacterium]